jgi:hypothetical protein
MRRRPCRACSSSPRAVSGTPSSSSPRAPACSPYRHPGRAKPSTATQASHSAPRRTLSGRPTGIASGMWRSNPRASWCSGRRRSQPRNKPPPSTPSKEQKAPGCAMGSGHSTLEDDKHETRGDLRKRPRSLGSRATDRRIPRSAPSSSSARVRCSTTCARCSSSSASARAPSWSGSFPGTTPLRRCSGLAATISRRARCSCRRQRVARGPFFG